VETNVPPFQNYDSTTVMCFHKYSNNEGHSTLEQYSSNCNLIMVDASSINAWTIIKKLFL